MLQDITQIIPYKPEKSKPNNNNITTKININIYITQIITYKFKKSQQNHINKSTKTNSPYNTNNNIPTKFYNI